VAQESAADNGAASVRSNGVAKKRLDVAAAESVTPDRAPGAVNKRFTSRKSLWLTRGTGMKRTVSESLTAFDSAFVHHKPLYLNQFQSLRGTAAPVPHAAAGRIAAPRASP